MSRVHHEYLSVVATATVLMLTACSSYSAIKTIPIQEASLNEVVVAFRVSPQLSDIGAGAEEGYVLFAKADGATEAIDIGYMDTGQLVWQENGLFFSGPEFEYHLSGTGLAEQPRGSDEEYETIRFPRSDTGGFISIYNDGFTEDGYLNRVVTGTGEQPQSWELPGLLTSISQCGERVVGITSGKELGSSWQATVGAPEQSEVLLQLYPQPESFEASILAQFDRGDTFVFDQFMENAPCVGDTVYTPAYQSPVLQPEDRKPVLRAWDTVSGEHKVIPLISEDGAEAKLSPDVLVSVQGHVSSDGTTYRWVQGMDGIVRSVDLSSGVVHELFDMELEFLMGESQFMVTENSIFVLNVNEKRAPLIFSRYDLDTGERQDYLEIKGLRSIDYFHMPRNVIRGMAINPEWVESHDES